LPHGQIAADPFHVVQLANKMVAQVRRRVLYAHPPANRDHPDPRLTGKMQKPRVLLTKVNVLPPTVVASSIT